VCLALLHRARRPATACGDILQQPLYVRLRSSVPPVQPGVIQSNPNPYLRPDTQPPLAPQKLDGLLQRWDRAQGQLAVARVEQAAAEALGCAAGAKRAPTVRVGCRGCLRPRVDAVEHYSRQVPPARAVAGVERARAAGPCVPPAHLA